jgi:hypothetical protein
MVAVGLIGALLSAAATTAPVVFVGYAVTMKSGLLVAETLTGLGVGHAVIMNRGVVVAAMLGLTVFEGINVNS